MCTKWLISALLVVCASRAWAQYAGGEQYGQMGQFGQFGQPAQPTQPTQTEVGDEEEEPLKKGVVIIKDRGLAFGVDCAPFIIRAIKHERFGVGVFARAGIINRLFGCAEVGFDKVERSNANFDYKSSGMYIHVGVDYDLFNNKLFPTNDNIFVGLRYGYAWQRHESPRYTIVDDYWGSYSGSVGKTPVNSHTAEFLGGLRCEVLRNFYMGATFRAKVLIHTAHDDQLKPYTIPGFGRCDKRVAIGFTYTLEYQLPFNRLRRTRDARSAAREARRQAKEAEGG